MITITRSPAGDEVAELTGVISGVYARGYRGVWFKWGEEEGWTRHARRAGQEYEWSLYEAARHVREGGSLDVFGNAEHAVTVMLQR